MLLVLMIVDEEKREETMMMMTFYDINIMSRVVVTVGRARGHEPAKMQSTKKLDDDSPLTILTRSVPS